MEVAEGWKVLGATACLASATRSDPVRELGACALLSLGVSNGGRRIRFWTLLMLTPDDGHAFKNMRDACKVRVMIALATTRSH